MVRLFFGAQAMRLLSIHCRPGWIFCLLIGLGLAGCNNAANTTPVVQPERLTKTLFTEKLGVFLVYAALKAGRPSEFELHLTNLAEGTPVARAEVTLQLRAKNNQAGTTIKAQASSTTGVYTVPVTFPKPGEYDIECELKHEHLSGRLTLTDFDVE